AVDRFDRTLEVIRSHHVQDWTKNFFTCHRHLALHFIENGGAKKKAAAVHLESATISKNFRAFCSPSSDELRHAIPVLSSDERSHVGLRLAIRGPDPDAFGGVSH